MTSQVLPHRSHGLSEIVNQQLIPLSMRPEFNVLAMPCRLDSLPMGVRVETRKIKGPRVPIKNRRPASQLSPITAIWPEDGLCTKNESFLIFVVSGNVRMQIGSQVLDCCGGTLLFIPPGHPHPSGEYGNGLSGVGSVLWMRECGRGVRCWITHLHDNQAWLSRSGEAFYFSEAEVTRAFFILCQELRANGGGQIVRYALSLFLLLLQRDLKAERTFNIAVAFNPQREKEEQIRPPGYDPVDLACEYVLSHLAAPLTIEGVARVVCMSRSSFARLFRNQVGKTFQEYVREHRLAQAQTFLCETDWTVRTISELCGFASYSSFSLFFSSRTGLTPHRYRRMHSVKIT